MKDGVRTPATTINDMRDMRRAGYKVRAIANTFGVSYGTALRYVRDIDIERSRPLTDRERNQLLQNWR